MNKINFPFSGNLKLLFNALIRDGNEIRVVGGSVRDFLSGGIISEVDLACKYLPEETIAILEQNNIKTLPTGIKHGTVTAFVGEDSFEITTLRVDKKTYGRDADVCFVDDFYLDAKRRDFTINAMMVDYDGNLYDYFNGLEDLKHKRVKFIGDPEERIKEDYLRILRFFRFSCFYAEEIDQGGFNAAVNHKEKIDLLSSDRVRNELIKILSCKNKSSLLKTLIILNESEILGFIVKSKVFDKKYIGNLLLLEQELGLEFGTKLRFASVILDSGSNIDIILARLNFSNRERNYLVSLINSNFLLSKNLDVKRLAMLLLDWNRDFLVDSLAIEFTRFKSLNQSVVADFLKIRQFIYKTEIPLFPIRGKDLLEMNIQPKNISKLLKLARINWIDREFNLTKDQILSFVASNS